MPMAGDAYSCPPVLLIAFNRPNLAIQMLEVIRKANPSTFYVACDGPRPNHPTDIDNVAQVRKLITAIDWCGAVHTKFQPANLGCGPAVSEAISWFLNEVGEGIILEDDCLPDLSFFPFCAAMLERYRKVSNVMQISGFNVLGGSYPMESDYLLSNVGFQWGWATWQRAWEKFDLKMSNWPRFKELGLHKYYPFTPSRNRIFDETYSGKIDTWDYQWAYTIASQCGLSVIPRVNLVRNIGFGGGTHACNAADSESYDVAVGSLSFPLRSWDFLFPDFGYDNSLLRALKPTLYERIRITMARAYHLLIRK